MYKCRDSGAVRATQKIKQEMTIPNPPWGKRGLNAGRRAPYLVDGVSALRVVAEEVPGKDDPGDEFWDARCAAC